jgi:hypothetical protein
MHVDSYTILCPYSLLDERLQLQKGADIARGDNAGNLKPVIVTWVNDLYGLSKPALRTNSKKEQGLENDNTGHLICPVEFSWDNLR